MTTFAFGYSDGTNFVITGDATVTSTPTRYSYTFTTPSVVGVDSYVGVFDGAGDPDGSIAVSGVMLNEGALRSYGGDTPISIPLGGPGVIIVTYSATGSTATGGFVRHHAGYLIPDSKKLASQHTNAELFERFVPYPVDDPSYTGPVLDAGFTSTFTASLFVTTSAGRGSATLPSVTTSLDAWNDGDTDQNIFTSWASASATGRYFRPRVTMATTTTTSPTNLGTLPIPGIVTSLMLKLSAPSKRKIINNFGVDATGTILNYAGVFHSPPNIQVTPADGNATSGGASSITATTAVIELFKAGVEVAGKCSIVLEGG